MNKSFDTVIIKGNIEEVKRRVNNDPTIVNRPSSGLDSLPLFDAVSFSHLEITRILLANGADVNAKTPRSKITSLHIAAQLLNYDMVELLLIKGADPNSANSDGWTPLHYCMAKDDDISNLLIACGANPNAKDKYGQTPSDIARVRQVNVDLNQIISTWM